MASVGKPGFDVDAYLRTTEPGRKIVQLNSAQVFFSQEGPADCVFYLHKGRVKISVLSSAGKEATICLVAASSFFWRKGDGRQTGPARDLSHGRYRLYRA
jgi:CRP-like cAMP-binding protein